MELTVVIPAYNEAERIPATLTAVADYLAGRGEGFELVVVDDGSEDGTGEVVRAWSEERSRSGREEAPARVVRIEHEGKGAAVAAGVRAAAGRLVLMSDADLSTPIEEWPRLRAELANGAKVAIGSRQMAGARIERHQPWARHQLGLLFGWLVRRLFPMGVIDSQCGFKAFEAAAAKELFAEARTRGYCFDVEIILRARARGYGVAEVPVRWRNHPDSRVKLARDWPQVLAELWRLRRELTQGRLGAGR
jgi:dolichyl-phosphate beta-glucosyltransferase